MKFSILLALALTYTTLASAQSAQPSDFHAANAKAAEQLTKQFAKLTPNSPCTDGQQACVNNQFAQCVGGKFELTQCSGGTQCTVLPLVNKPGTSITCDTAADQKARIAASLGQNSPTGDSTNNGTSGTPPAGTKNDAGKGKGKGKGKKGKSKDKKGKNNAQGNPKDVNQGQNNNGTLPVQQKLKAPPTNSTNGDFHQQNAAEAESLQKQFNSLTPNSPCTNGQQACVKKQFAQCVNNKFALTACSNGLECAALPLVLKPGTSIACTTEADRQARINAAKSAKK